MKYIEVYDIILTDLNIKGDNSIISYCKRSEILLNIIAHEDEVL